MISTIEGLGLNPLSGLTNASFEKVAESFEAVFISQLVRSMRESFCKDFGVGSGFGTEDYLYMLDQALSEGIARAGGIGIKKQLAQWADSANVEKDSSKSEGNSSLGGLRSRGRLLKLSGERTDNSIETNCVRGHPLRMHSCTNPGTPLRTDEEKNR